jgi:hypothetical protein
MDWIKGLEMKRGTRHQWLMPIILVTQEAEIKRTAVQSQPEQVLLETLS